MLGNRSLVLSDTLNTFHLNHSPTLEIAVREAVTHRFLRFYLDVLYARCSQTCSSVLEIAVKYQIMLHVASYILQPTPESPSPGLYVFEIHRIFDAIGYVG
jgi:hypothetical protein